MGNVNSQPSSLSTNVFHMPAHTYKHQYPTRMNFQLYQDCQENPCHDEEYGKPSGVYPWGLSPE